MIYDRTLPHREYFYQIAQIPHGSGNEKALSDYIVGFAKDHGLEYKQDELWNVIIRKPASAGYESAKPLCIQAHMDMVCEKNKGVEHNFETDPLKFVVSDDGILRADGTTLGADDCTGVAYMLAILADDSLPHPPLECVFTTQEEVGMIGAQNLKPEDITARRFVTLDGGGETMTMLSSAGGARVNVTLPLATAPNGDGCLRIGVRGLTGGHSGGEIHREKGNANKLLARILYELAADGCKFRLVSFAGGLKENAIPREADAVIAISGDMQAAVAGVERSAARIATELEFSDGGFRVETEAASASSAYTPEDSAKAVQMLFLMPSGFIARSMAIEGLTMTSLNIGVVESDGAGMTLRISLRSMLTSCIDDLYNRIALVAELFGGSAQRSADYPGWNYRKESEMRVKLGDAVRELYGQEVVMQAVHGGTECGFFAALHPDMDIISLGPVARYIHSPDEELDLASFDRTYTLLTNLVSRCKD